MVRVSVGVQDNKETMTMGSRKKLVLAALLGSIMMFCFVIGLAPTQTPNSLSANAAQGVTEVAISADGVSSAGDNFSIPVGSEQGFSALGLTDGEVTDILPTGEVEWSLASTGNAALSAAPGDMVATVSALSAGDAGLYVSTGDGLADMINLTLYDLAGGKVEGTGSIEITNPQDQSTIYVQQGGGAIPLVMTSHVDNPNDTHLVTYNYGAKASVSAGKPPYAGVIPDVTQFTSLTIEAIAEQYSKYVNYTDTVSVTITEVDLGSDDDGIPNDPFDLGLGGGDQLLVRGHAPGGLGERQTACTGLGGGSKTVEIPVGGVTASVTDPIDNTRVTTVVVPPGLLEVGEEGVLVLTVADNLTDLVGSTEAAQVSPRPVGGLVTSASYAEVSILISTDGGATFAEIDNARLADNPLSLTMDGVVLASGDNARFFSYDSTMIDVDAGPAVDLQIDAANGSTWDQTASGSVVSDGSIAAELNSLSILAPFNTPGNVSILSVDPPFGPAGSTTSVEITVANLTGTPTVEVDGQAAAVTNVNGGVITVTVPVAAALATPAASHGATVAVTDDNGFDAVANGFTYNGPTVSSINPDSGSEQGGTSVTIGGAGMSGASVTIGGTPLSVGSATDTQITGTTNASTPVTGDVKVTLSNNYYGVLSNGFTYILAGPTVTSVTPDSVPNDGGYTIDVRGAFFRAPDGTLEAKVASGEIYNDVAFTPAAKSPNPGVDPKAPTVDYIDDTHLVAITPVVATDGVYKSSLYNLYVATRNYQTAKYDQLSISNLVNFSFIDAIYRTLRIYGVYPPQGPVSGGNTVTITGNGFPDMDCEAPKTVKGAAVGNQLILGGATLAFDSTLAGRIADNTEQLNLIAALIDDLLANADTNNNNQVNLTEFQTFATYGTTQADFDRFNAAVPTTAITKADKLKIKLEAFLFLNPSASQSDFDTLDSNVDTFISPTDVPQVQIPVSLNKDSAQSAAAMTLQISFPTSALSPVLNSDGKPEFIAGPNLSLWYGKTVQTNQLAKAGDIKAVISGGSSEITTFDDQRVDGDGSQENPFLIGTLLFNAIGGNGSGGTIAFVQSGTSAATSAPVNITDLSFVSGTVLIGVAVIDFPSLTEVLAGAIDGDNDGKISFAEYQAFFAQGTQEAFDALDSTGDGFLSAFDCPGGGPATVKVYFGQNAGAVTDVFNNEITVTAPAGDALGLVDVRVELVSDPTEFDIKSAGYEYLPDTTPPVITRLGADPVTVEAGTVYNDAGATATDDIDGDLTLQIVTTNPVNTAVIGTYTVRYNVSDSSGNAAVEVTRTVNVVDTTLPVITRLGLDPATVEVGTVYVDAGATALDNYDGNITGQIVTTNPVNTAVIGTYTVRYNVSDSSGNAAIEVTRTVNVVDTTPPVIVLLGANPLNVNQNDVFSDPGATATDNFDGDISANIVATGLVDTAVLGTYQRAYNVSDSSGNAAVEVIRTVNVVLGPDTTPPVISIVGANPAQAEAGQPYVDAGATALDDRDGDITGSIVTVNNVNTGVLGSYTVTYNVSDAGGNPAVEQVRTVNVVDTTAPVITRLGDAEVTVVRGTSYSDAGATATDSFSGDLTGQIVTTNPVDINVVGDYTVRYNVSDASGNAAAEVTRLVHVITDVVIAINGITPTRGWIFGGESATISGAGLATSTIVKFNGVQATVLSASEDGTSATVRVPAFTGDLEAGDVAVDVSVATPAKPIDPTVLVGGFSYVRSETQKLEEGTIFVTAFSFTANLGTPGGQDVILETTDTGKGSTEIVSGTLSVPSGLVGDTQTVYGIARATKTPDLFVNQSQPGQLGLDGSDIPGIWNFDIHVYDANFQPRTDFVAETGGKGDVPITLEYPVDDANPALPSTPRLSLLSTWSHEATLSGQYDASQDGYNGGTVTGGKYESQLLDTDVTATSGNFATRVKSRLSGLNTSFVLRNAPNTAADIEDLVGAEFDNVAPNQRVRGRDTIIIKGRGLAGMVGSFFTITDGIGGIGQKRVVEVPVDAADEFSATFTLPTNIQKGRFSVALSLPTATAGVVLIEVGSLIKGDGFRIWPAALLALYALLSGADQGDGGGGGGTCFIATAAYGTPLAGQIDTLRDLRDTFMLNNAVGTAFVDMYYNVSPAIADVVAQYPVLAAAVRLVLAPVIVLGKFILALPHVSMALLGAGLLVGARRRMKKAKKA